MENKKILSSKEATLHLILWFILYLFLAGWIYTLLFAFLGAFLLLHKLILLTFISSALLEGGVSALAWLASISSTFKKATFYAHDMNKIFKNLIIFVVIFCLISGSISFLQIDNNYKKYVADEVESRETLMSLSPYTSDDYSTFESEVNKAVKKERAKLVAYMVVSMAVLIASYVGILFAVKKNIMKHSIPDNAATPNAPNMQNNSYNRQQSFSPMNYNNQNFNQQNSTPANYNNQHFNQQSYPQQNYYNQQQYYGGMQNYNPNMMNNNASSRNFQQHPNPSGNNVNNYAQPNNMPPQNANGNTPQSPTNTNK